MRACEGLRVIEIAEGSGGAVLCGQMFAGLGAHVVKLEHSSGDPLRRTVPNTKSGTSLAFHILNAGKQSCVIAPDNANLLRELLRDADVILIDDEHGPDLNLLNDQYSLGTERAVLCHISTFGHAGLRSSWRGTALIAGAMGGLMACTGHPDRPPVTSGVPYADHVAAMFAFSAIMAALAERERSGIGQTIDIASVDCLIALLGNFIPTYFLSGKTPKRIGNRHTIAAPWNLYPASDGQLVICTGTGGASWWRIVCNVIGRPELINDDRYNNEAKRVQLVDEVDAVVSEWTKRHTMADAVAKMSAEGIPASEIVSVEQILSDPHYTSIRGMVNTFDIQGDRVLVAGLPLKVGGWDPPKKIGPVLNVCEAGSAQQRTFERKVHSGDALPLKGFRILEFGSRTSVPMAGKILADLGADVIKIEPPKGESLRGAGQQVGGSSYLFQINNAGKRSLVIDPKNSRGRDLILQVAKTTDVFIENLAPGALEKLGLSFEDLRAVNPSIIYCSVSGFGHESRYGKKKALDTVVQAASGIMHLTGYPDYEPVKLGISAVDLACATGVVGAVIAAMRRRAEIGKGAHIDLAMADIGAWMTQLTWPSIERATGHPFRLGNRSATMTPHNIFPTQDGFLALAVETDTQWEALTVMIADAKLSNPVLSIQEGRRAHTDIIEAVITAWSREGRSAELAQQLQENGIPAAPVRSLSEIAEDEETQRRGLVVTVEHPTAGALRVLGSPLHLSRTPGSVRRYAPLLGEHTREILAEAGIAETEFAGLLQDGVVAIVKNENSAQLLKEKQ